MGPVFRAFDPDHDRLVAVKLFRLDLPPERVHQLVAEFERLIAAGLAHPAVVAPVATGIAGVTAYLAQDYVAAESLDIALRHGPASVADSMRVAAQLAGALDAAAAIHIEHGVLHPRDVLLSGDETRLTGLGIARAVERIGVATQVRRPYTAPERAIGSHWDRRADVFGLAAMIHEMLWGRRVAGTGDGAVASLTEIAGSDLPRLRAVFGRALAEDPAERFGTALEFAGVLKEAFSQQSAVAGRQSTSPRLPTADRRLATADRRLETEPRLPLEPPSDEPQLPSLNLREPESSRFAVIEAIDAPPAILDAEMPPVLPPELVKSYRPSPDGVLADGRSRSAISPLAFALLIGAALGFAAGFGVGTWGRSSDPGETAVSDASVASNTGPAATTGPAREFTEGTVAGASPAAEAAPKPAPAAPIGGSLLVRSTPLGARVFVDGREYGRTPLTVGSLSRGAHHVRVIRDGYVPDERQVTVTSAQRAHSMTVRLSPQRVAPAASVASRPAAPSAAPLTVESRPAGATVFLDGRLVGTTPLVVPAVAAGEHALHLDRDGYRRWSSAIRIVATERNRVTASLDR